MTISSIGSSVDNTDADADADADDADDDDVARNRFTSRRDRQML